ncbi:MAG TPA: neutral/alkaline non-lysosomal ceramidase N-terminal domain-containing protein [Pirellulales bacterium]|nr:neutral/alkaline non-lysosomal ceramidase N-terminal domain-containing protein [Pirellulales bacterium]
MLAAAVIVVGAAQILAAESAEFLAGAATSNITPPLGVPIVGGFESPLATGIHDELRARCLVLDDGMTRLGIVVCDNLGIVRECCDEAKRLASAATKIPADRILISATHTHSGPSARYSSRMTPDAELTDYQRFLAQRIADGLARAVNNLEPARIGWGVGREPEQVFNRRWHMKPGPDLRNPFDGVDQVRMNPPGGSPNLLEPAGPTDPEVGFLSIQSRDGRPIALLANYSLHYVGGVKGPVISADYFAMFADEIQRLLGADRLDPPFVGVMSNGTSGDINNIDFLCPRPRQPPYERMRQVARAVAAEVYRVHQTVAFHNSAPLGMTEREMSLAVRKPSAELLERAKQLVAGSRKPDHPRDVAYAQRAIELASAPDEVTIVLQALRIGDVGIATSPFETFCETGLGIKQRSPWRPTFTIELANGSYGYLPTPEQHRLGGYETWLGTNNVEVNASRKLTDALLEMLDSLKTP